MSAQEKDPCPTLADALDATRWDYQPGADQKMLLRPVGTVFANFPWGYRPQYLGPSTVSDLEPENGAGSDTDDGAATQPVVPLTK